MEKQFESAKIFDANSPESLEEVLNKISKLEDRKNYMIALDVEILEHFDKCIIVPEGYDDINIHIVTYKKLGNHYQIASGSVKIDEINVLLLENKWIQSFNSFEFTGKCKLSGKFCHSDVSIKDSVIGTNVSGQKAKIKIFNNSILHFWDKGSSYVSVLDKATFYGVASMIEIYEQGLVYSYKKSIISIHSLEATVFAFDRTEILAVPFYQKCNNSNITLYNHSLATIYSNMPNLTCHDDSIVYAFYDYQGNDSHYRTNKIYKDSQLKHWYKVAIKDTEGIYHSIYNSSFVYKMGDIIKPKENFDNSPFNSCGSGIHLSTIQYAIRFGIESSCRRLVILEMSPTPDAEIVVPYRSIGKIRVSEAKVLREVPLDELDDFKAIAKSEPFIYGEESE